MLLVATWPWLEGNRDPLHADTWVRALTSGSSSGLTWSRTTLSRAWKHLEELGLIEPRARDGRLVRIAPRREDAREEYTAPAGRTDRWNTYFAVPDAFWHSGLFGTLSLPALAMFLLVASETSKNEETWFTFEKLQQWYGLKTASSKKGVKEW